VRLEGLGQLEVQCLVYKAMLKFQTETKGANCYCMMFVTTKNEEGNGINISACLISTFVVCGE
jgi:ferredoxin-thioredoxin reductase catalytic subunit